MKTATRWHIAYTIGDQRWDFHNILTEMVQFEIERLQDCENATILSVMGEVR